MRYGTSSRRARRAALVHQRRERGDVKLWYASGAAATTRPAAVANRTIGIFEAHVPPLPGSGTAASSRANYASRHEVPNPDALRENVGVQEEQQQTHEDGWRDGGAGGAGEVDQRDGLPEEEADLRGATAVALP